MPRLKRESKELKGRAVDGVILSIEFFNRPSERGRADAVLIFLQCAFEMLLKAAIMQKRGTIHERGSANSHTFRKCLGIAKSDILIISEPEARLLGTLSDLRDCSMHHYQIVSENFCISKFKVEYCCSTRSSKMCSRKLLPIISQCACSLSPSDHQWMFRF